jgi:hypothetical protein
MTPMRGTANSAEVRYDTELTLARMTGFFNRVWRRLTFTEQRRKVRHTVWDPRFGKMEYYGSRSERTGMVSGDWRVTPPGFSRYISVDFPSIAMTGSTPSAADLDQLEAFLSNMDAFFERCRSKVAEKYLSFVEEPMPEDWRAVFRLHAIRFFDPEEPDVPWGVDLWCENAQHWFVVEFERDELTYVGIEG